MRETRTSLSSLELNLRLQNRLEKDGFYWIEDLLRRVDARKFIQMYGRTDYRTMREVLEESGRKFSGMGQGIWVSCTYCDASFPNFKEGGLSAKGWCCGTCDDGTKTLMEDRHHWPRPVRPRISRVPEKNVDLPREENRWLINCETGLVEAWDHTDNTKSGDDTHALLLCIEALGREFWTHPSHSRKDAAEAVELILKRLLCVN